MLAGSRNDLLPKDIGPLSCGPSLWSCRESNPPQKFKLSCGNTEFDYAKERKYAKRRETKCGHAKGVDGINTA